MRLRILISIFYTHVCNGPLTCEWTAKFNGSWTWSETEQCTERQSKMVRRMWSWHRRKGPKFISQDQKVFKMIYASMYSSVSADLHTAAKFLPATATKPSAHWRWQQSRNIYRNLFHWRYISMLQRGWLIKHRQCIQEVKTRFYHHWLLKYSTKWAPTVPVSASAHFGQYLAT